MASSELFTLLPPINTLSTSNGRKVAKTKDTTPWWLPINSARPKCFNG